MNFYYITYSVSSDSSGDGPSYISMGCLENYDFAEKYIVQYFYDHHQKVFFESAETDDNLYEVTADYNEFPRLISNDPRFYLLYKGVFSFTDFRLFCRLGDPALAITPLQKCKFSIGKGTPVVFEYFLRLISGEGKYVYEYETYETEYDEDTGRRYSMPVGVQWRFRGAYLENETIRSRFNLE